MGAVAHLDGAVLDRVEHLQARHDLAGSERLDLEFAVGRLETYFANSSQAPYNVSSDFGQLAVSRHFSVGAD